VIIYASDLESDDDSDDPQSPVKKIKLSKPDPQRVLEQQAELLKLNCSS
jgi:hypothetical protein